jgi:hypothetical protein
MRARRKPKKARRFFFSKTWSSFKKRPEGEVSRYRDERPLVGLVVLEVPTSEYKSMRMDIKTLTYTHCYSYTFYIPTNIRSTHNESIQGLRLGDADKG